MAGEGTQVEAVLQHGADSCEQVAKAIEHVAAAANRIVCGPLELRSAAVLIRQQLPRGSKLELEDIVNVLRAAEAMARWHLKTPTPERGKAVK